MYFVKAVVNSNVHFGYQIISFFFLLLVFLQWEWQWFLQTWNLRDWLENRTSHEDYLFIIITNSKWSNRLTCVLLLYLGECISAYDSQWHDGGGFLSFNSSGQATKRLAKCSRGFSCRLSSLQLRWSCNCLPLLSQVLIFLSNSSVWHDLLLVHVPYFYPLYDKCQVLSCFTPYFDLHLVNHLVVAGIELLN